jgi:hypothetical protein
MSIIYRVLPISIFAVGCAALTFQTTVLHPFHNELDEEFKQLRNLEEADRKFHEFEQEALQAVNLIDARVDELMKLKVKNMLN